jgi:hypothetical protein
VAYLLLGLLVIFAIVAIVAIAAPPNRWVDMFLGDKKRK